MDELNINTQDAATDIPETTTEIQDATAEIQDVATDIEDPAPDTPQAAPGTPGGMVLRTEGLVKIYGKRTVANGVSINVRQGEIVGLLGPNGAGKTTSFYMTTGLVIPNAGHVYLDDLEITDYPVYKRARAGIGYLPQEVSVFRKMSVEDNIMAVLEMTGKPREYQLQKLESLISEFRLQKCARTRATNSLEVSADAPRLLAVWLSNPSSSCSTSHSLALTLLLWRTFSTSSGN